MGPFSSRSPLRSEGDCRCDWFRAALVSQRTRAIETDVDVMRGLLVVLTFDNVYVYTSLFEPASDDQTPVVKVGTEF